MLNLEIDIEHNENEMVAVPSINDTASVANGFISDYFSNELNGRTLKDEARDRFGDQSSWHELSSIGDGWPIELIFRSEMDSVTVYWNKFLLKSWNAFAAHSDLIFVLSHNLRNGQEVEIESIDIDQYCDGSSSPTISPTTRTPTVSPTTTSPTVSMSPTAQPTTVNGSLTITPLWTDHDYIARVELDEKTIMGYGALNNSVNPDADTVFVNESYWLMKRYLDITKWYSVCIYDSIV